MNRKNTKDCGCCCELLPDYEWLDVENKQRVDTHVAECRQCRSKKELIRRSFACDDEGSRNMLPSIDFTDEIMRRITSLRPQVAHNTFLPPLLGLLAVLELIAIHFTGAASIVNGFNILARCYQDEVSMFAAFLNEYLFIFEKTGYYSLSADYLPAGTNIILVISAGMAAAVLITISKRKERRL